MGSRQDPFGEKALATKQMGFGGTNRMRELQFDECLVYLPIFSHQYLILEKYAESILKNVDQMVSIVSHFHPRKFPGWLFCSFQMGSSHQLSVNVYP